MEYTINRTKRNLIILCSSLLILSQITWGLFFFFKGPTILDSLQVVIKNIFYILPYGYLMLVLVGYFKHFQLKLLQIVTTTILILEMVTYGCSMANLYIPIVPRSVLSAISAMWVSSIIIWIIFLFRPNTKDYPAVNSIRGFAVGILFYLVLGIIPMFLKPDNIFASLQLISMTLAIPFIFTIDFALKLQLKE